MSSLLSMMKLLLVLTWIITVYGNSCDLNAILCVGTVNNETGIDGSGCLATESCRVTLSLSHDVESDKFVMKVDSRPGNIWSLIGLVQDEKIKRYFQFKPRNRTDMDEVRLDQRMVPNFGLDLGEPFSVRISAWIPTSTRFGAKTLMVEDVVVSFAGTEESSEEMLDKRRKKRQEIEVVEYEDVPVHSLASVDEPADDPSRADDPASGDVVQEEPDGRVLLMDDAGDVQGKAAGGINVVNDGANQAATTSAATSSAVTTSAATTSAIIGSQAPYGSASVTIPSILLSFSVLASLLL